MYFNLICLGFQVLSWCSKSSYFDCSFLPTLSFLQCLVHSTNCRFFCIDFIFKLVEFFLEPWHPKHTPSLTSLSFQSWFLLDVYHQETATFSCFISLVILLMSLHISTKTVRLLFNSRTEGGTHIKTQI